MTEAEAAEMTNGLKWLVEDRDQLRQRVAVLENELVRRDSVSLVDEHFFIEVSAQDAYAHAIKGASTKAIADALAQQLARHIVGRSLHRISVMPDGGYRLAFLAPTWKPS